MYSRDFESEQIGSLLPEICLHAGHAPDQRGEKVASQEPCLSGRRVPPRGAHSPSAVLFVESPIAQTPPVAQACVSGAVKAQSTFGQSVDKLARKKKSFENLIEVKKPANYNFINQFIPSQKNITEMRSSKLSKGDIYK